MAAVAAMLEAGVNVNSIVDEQGTRPLLCAASMGNIDVVRMLAVYPGVMLDIPVSLIHNYTSGIVIYRQFSRICYVHVLYWLDITHLVPHKRERGLLSLLQAVQ